MSEKNRCKIIDTVLNNGFSLLNLDYSPIKGPKGNIEYLCFIEKSESSENLCSVSAQEVVEQSYAELNK